MTSAIPILPIAQFDLFCAAFVVKYAVDNKSRLIPSTNFVSVVPVICDIACLIPERPIPLPGGFLVSVYISVTNCIVSSFLGARNARVHFK